MYQRLGQFVARHWLAIILAWAALVPTVRWIAPSWDQVTNDGDLAYLPERMTTVRAERLMEEAFPHNRAKSQFVIAFERGGPDAGRSRHGRARGQLVLGNRRAWAADRQRRDAEERSRRAPVDQPRRPGGAGDGEPGREFMTFANIEGLELIESKLAQVREAPDFPAGLEMGISGSAAIGGDMLAAAEESIRNIELATVILVVVILLIVYRAPLLTIIPLASIVISVMIAMGLVALLSQLGTVSGFEWCHYKVFKTTKIFVVVVLFGSGTDYCLFLIARYREELERGLDHQRAVASAVTHTGEAVVATP